ncbi:hypothetical protein KJ641_02715 [Patescibacteria group bacterium]|nr:hypothetical protein [Patescibacteria group bacterium]MBU1895757.1 hypothetical protein [Patescibacteria group bacterium]
MSEKKLIIFIIIVALIPISGIALGFWYSSLPEHHPQDSKENCKSVGGEWNLDIGEEPCFFDAGLDPAPSSVGLTNSIIPAIL